jgi:predicted nucleotidyltransferase
MSIFTETLQNHKTLSERIDYSKQFLQTVQKEVKKKVGSDWKNVAIFAAGSLGRFEAGRSSDLDVFILAKHKKEFAEILSPISHLDEIRLFAKLIEVNAALELPEFSGDGRYLKVHSLDRIISSTGDAHDDSENLFTTRMLLLLESQAIWNNNLRTAAIDKVLANYFRDGKGKRDFRPLFLLNDILRYWRTLCLNYERDRVRSTKWWKTNLNLKFSRKLTIFSTVLLILTGAAKTQEDFLKITEMVPLERLAFALDTLDDSALLASFVQFLDDYESFLAAKSFKEIDGHQGPQKDEYREKAERFGDLIYSAVMSKNIDSKLRKYVLI